MASLLFDQAAKTFYVRFRYGGRSFKRSLDTANQKLARDRDQLIVIGEPLPWQKEEPRDPRIDAARTLQFLSDMARDYTVKR
jgi:hypothetical protein